MSLELSDEGDARAAVVSLQTEPQPRCPQLRACCAEGLYPVKGYCVLEESPGWFMIPSIEEYQESCTTLRWGDCYCFMGDFHKGTEDGAASPAPG
jgi:hypothetical protein